jgi:hypothetical protein
MSKYPCGLVSCMRWHRILTYYGKLFAQARIRVFAMSLAVLRSLWRDLTDESLINLAMS